MRRHRLGFGLGLLLLMVLAACGGGGGKATETPAPSAAPAPTSTPTPSPTSTPAPTSTPSPVTGTSYCVDAQHGSDASGDGSAAKPYQTLAKAWGRLVPGDALLLASGTYPKLVAGRTGPDDQGWAQRAQDVFSGWVTIRSMDGQDAHLTSLDLGTWTGSDGNAIPFSMLGQCDVYLRFENLTIDDGVSIMGCRHVELKNCRIHRAGEITGSDDALNNQTGVVVLNGRYVTLEGNDISHVAIGIMGMTSDFTVRNNDIHDNSHDGFRIYGGANWLLEGNRIHDLDDGVGDGGSWGMHVDGIQVFFPTTGSKWATEMNGLVMRGNTFYHLESMGIMVNASSPPTTNYRNWVFENNVMGPVGGNLLHWGARIDGFVFRHNTVVYTPDTTWTSAYRTLDATHYNVAWWPDGDGKLVYNNIFVDGHSSQPKFTDPSYAWVANNLYYVAPWGALEPGGMVMNALPYAPGDWTAALLPGSQAMDGGTRLGADRKPLANPLEIDLRGLPRDNRPDIGAYEVQGRTPPVEAFAP